MMTQDKNILDSLLEDLLEKKYSGNPTEQQKRTLEALKADILKHNTLAEGEYEYKNWEISQYSGSPLIFLRAEVGRIGDEGTMAAVLCRVRYHLVIGRRGGVEALSGKKVQGYMKSIIWGRDR